LNFSKTGKLLLKKKSHLSKKREMMRKKKVWVVAKEARPNEVSVLIRRVFSDLDAARKYAEKDRAILIEVEVDEAEMNAGQVNSLA